MQQAWFLFSPLAGTLKETGDTCSTGPYFKGCQLLWRPGGFCCLCFKSPYPLAPVELGYVAIQFILLKIQSLRENMIMLFSDSCVWERDRLNQLPGMVGDPGPANPGRAAVLAKIFIILMTLLPILSASELCF